MPVSHLDKVYFPRKRYTKGDVLHYYQEISSYILPYLKNRPMVLKRFPGGIGEEGFIQKNVESLHLPEKVKSAAVQHEEKMLTYLLIQNQTSLEYALNLGTIEFHPFHYRLRCPEHPDYFILDLDPEGVTFNAVIKVAEVVHELLDAWQIPSYCKTSGARGLHIYIPLHAKYSQEQVTAFSRVLALALHEEMPKMTSLERHPSKREKKVYLDVLQNRSKQTVVAPYSLRALPEAPVSTPLDWDEVRKGLNPKCFTLKTIPSRLAEVGDLFHPVLGTGANLQKWMNLE